MTGRCAFISLVIFFLPSLSAAQSVSGVINHYAGVTAIACDQITTSAAVAVTAGDTVLLMQMKGVTIDENNVSTYGDVLDYGSTGNFELAEVSSASGTSITLTAPLASGFDLAFPTQIIRVPHYGDVTISGTLTCDAWDGTSGGVLIFIADGTVTMDADIDVSGKGFRAGTACLGGFGCGSTAYFLDNSICSGGKKGESVYVPVFSTHTGGRGKSANGGGGGNPGNCGGGGGGNFASGGHGGYEYNLCFNTIQGIGGAALDYSLGKIFMGGAGGTGFNDNGQAIYAGQSGGGIVIIVAGTIISNDHEIRANGTDVPGITNDESAGGGGAGGTVCLDVQNYSGTLDVLAQGGNGGSTYNNIFTSDCHGPGGGGGGGVIWVNAPSLPAEIAFDATAGTPGLVLNPASACFNTTHGATAGMDGGAIFDFPGLAIHPPLTVDLGPDTSICPSSSLLLNGGAGYVAYLWQDGSTDSVFTVIDSGSYSLLVTDSNGCSRYDTVIITLYPPLEFSNLSDTIVCEGETVTLIQTFSDTYTYQWQDGSGNATLTTDLPGLYWVLVTDTSGCFGYDSAVVSHFVDPPLELGNDTSICPGTQLILTAGFFADYLWQDGSVDGGYLATVPGQYSVSVTDSNGCVQQDTIELISFYDQPPSALVPDTFVCPQVPRWLHAPQGYAGYEWNDGSDSSALEIDQPGVYWITVTNELSCRNTDTVLVEPECPTGLYIPNAFSPNGDGINDWFTAIGYNVTAYSMSVYNRWGEQLFLSDEITEGWDGTYRGKQSEMGVYVYRISFTGELKGISTSGSYSGNVTLIR
jgi:gliding motility-associated-like protein